MIQALTYLAQSLRHITQNPGYALRIVALPFLLTLMVEFWHTRSYLMDEYGPPGIMEVIVILCNFAMVGMIAVGWHRLILLGEKPGAFAVTWRGGIFFSYVVRWFFVGLFIALLVLLAGLMIWVILSFVLPQFFFVSFDDFANPYTSDASYHILFAAVVLLGNWAFLYLLFRYGMVLPHTAIEAKWIDIGAAWRMTKPMARPIFLLAGIAAFFQTLAIVVPITIYEKHVVNDEWPPLQLWSEYAFTAFELALYAITVLIGASILTTLYSATNPPDDPTNKIKRRSNLPDV